MSAFLRALFESGKRAARWQVVLGRGVLRPVAAHPTPALSSPFASTGAADEITDENRENYRRRLLYRSQQRGWLELDLVMGEWASKNLEALSDDMLLEYSELLDEVRLFRLSSLVWSKAPPKAQNRFTRSDAGPPSSLFLLRRRTRTSSSGSRASWTRRTT